MMRHKTELSRVFAFAACCVVTAPLAAQATKERAPLFDLPAGVRFVPDVPFRLGGIWGRGADTSRMDLFLPAGGGRMPAIVFVGGDSGARRSDQLGREAARLASRGFVGAVIDNRPRVIGARPPIVAVVEDATLAVRWLRAHADDYGIDRTRIGMMGVSVGALVAAAAALPGWVGVRNNDNLGFAEGVTAVVLVEPLLDLADTTLGVKAQTLLAEALGAAGLRDTAGRARLSPMSYSRGKANRDVRPHVPPFLFVHGTADEVFPFRQSESMAAQMRSKGFVAELFAVDGAGHDVLTSAAWQAPALRTIDDFLDRVLAASAGHPKWVDSSPAWAPDGSRIAFESNYGGSLEIWLMRADGSDLRSLGVSGSMPAWSPDGSRIAFAGSDGRLRVVNVDGSGHALVTRDTTEYVGGPQWLPDGQHISYGNEGNLQLVRVADGQVARVPGVKPRGGCASWSADGSEVFYHVDGAQSDLYRTTIAEGTSVRLTNSPTNEFCPRISPDGSRIAFQRRPPGRVHEHIDIWVLRADGREEINLTDHFANDRYASWSPDGKWIAFSSTRDGNYDIYVVRPDGTGLRRLTNR